MRSDLREAWLHRGTEVLAYWKESLRRNSASTAAPGKTVDLPFAPAEECRAGVSCGVGAALVRDWPGGGPRPTNSHRGRCRGGEPGGAGPPCGSRSGTGVSAGAPGALLEGRVPGRRSVLSTALHARPEVLPSDGSAFPRPLGANSRAQGGAAERTPDLRGPAAGPGSWAGQASEGAKPLCRG